MEQKPSIAELRREAGSRAMYAVVGVAVFTVFFLGARLGEGLWSTVAAILCVVPGLGCLCFSCASGWGALENCWMVHQIRYGVNIFNRSQVQLREGFRLAGFTALFFTTTILCLLWGFNNLDVGYTLFMSSIPGVLTYCFGRGVLETFRQVGQLEEIERREANNVRSGIVHDG